ncbi:MAG: hypothetical protein KDA45_08895, partial [Planctomycetales bacterium]|nr:hypothetical protein [Planctomycetales bacterium]
MLELPLGKESAEAAQFSLVELRRGAPQAFQANHLVIDRGALQVSPLEPGDYVLHDYESGQRVKIVVGDAESRQGFVAAAHRLLQTSRQVPLVIRQAEVVDGQLLVQVSGADEMTRVHIVAHDLLPDISNSRQLQLPYPPLMQRSIPAVQSHYVDSLQLDEEYSYILSRQGMKKFPGNMLPQPSLLVHPWEVSVTENQQQEAQLGDVMPNMAAPGAPPAESSAKRRSTATASRPDWKSYDFLAGGAAIVANLALVEGQVRIPLEPLAGYSSINVVVVHPTSSDSRQVVLQDSELRVRDQRLRESFDAQQHLSQVQKVELLAAGERKIFGDPRTRRLQAYTTVAEVFQLYSTLLDDPRWDKFRFVGRWHQLTDEERRARYNEMACHELNFFLYHKDPQFFAQVVQPLIAQKLDKQLVDRWLLGEPLEAYDELWQMQRLNTL